ncbi:hypothetical protein Goshw_017525 [Gossypium schwendimanii]|uniref:Uncharacterized protein n=1 Tax=Gossypium schwendimanii TaxID=34291 RepID=A0A7J9NDP0_GOSSC|nr:hypothetical protein [Gossypium schwendimanii]
MEEEKMNLRLDTNVQKLQTLAVQADMLSVKYELESSRGQELSSLLREIRVLQKEMQDQMQERLEKIQPDMAEKMIESQKNMMTQLTQLLVGGNDKERTLWLILKKDIMMDPSTLQALLLQKYSPKLRNTHAGPLSQSGLNGFKLAPQCQ